jgi:tetratricopeptide (TPR) repeat protein
MEFGKIVNGHSEHFLHPSRHILNRAKYPPQPMAHLCFQAQSHSVDFVADRQQNHRTKSFIPFIDFTLRMLMALTSNASQRFLRRQFGRFLSVLSCLALLGGGTALAADPFRIGKEALPIGPSLESAFNDFFRNGSYLNSSQKLKAAELENPNEPLVYTLQAALAYMNEQPVKMLALAKKTGTVAMAMETKNEARSHLYRGLAQGLEGASYYLKDGEAGLLSAFPYVSSMLLEIDKARQLAPADPEVNLVVGYVQTILASQKMKPYSDAIQSFSKAKPSYLALRGQALVYRDTKDYPQAQTMVEKALADAPTNPELFYLKGQILALQQKPTDAIAFFDKALTLGKQLPESTKKQIRKERNSQISKVSQGAVLGPAAPPKAFSTDGILPKTSATPK